jgi:hypothetical protein
MQSIHISKHEYINAFGTDAWRQSVRNSVNYNHDYLFPPPSQQPESSPPTTTTGANSPASTRKLSFRAQRGTCFLLFPRPTTGPIAAHFPASYERRIRSAGSGPSSDGCGPSSPTSPSPSTKPASTRSNAEPLSQSHTSTTLRNTRRLSFRAQRKISSHAGIPICSTGNLARPFASSSARPTPTRLTVCPNSRSTTSSARLP